MAKVLRTIKSVYLPMIYTGVGSKKIIYLTLISSAFFLMLFFAAHLFINSAKAQLIDVPVGAGCKSCFFIGFGPGAKWSPPGASVGGTPGFAPGSGGIPGLPYQSTIITDRSITGDYDAVYATYVPGSNGTGGGVWLRGVVYPKGDFGVNIKISGPSGPHFTVEISPTSRSIEAGDSTDYDVTISSVNSFAGEVKLKENLTNSSKGITAIFSSTSLTLTEGSSTTVFLTAATKTTTPKGTNNFRVTGESESISAFASAGLIVREPTPDPWLLTKIGEVGSSGKIDAASGTPPSGKVNADYGVLASQTTSNFKSAKDWLVGGYQYNSESLEVSADIYKELFDLYESRGIKNVNLKNRNNVIDDIEKAVGKNGGILLHEGNLAIRDSDRYDGRPVVLFVGGNMDIQRDIRIRSNTGVIFIVGGDVKIDDSVDQLAGFFIVNGVFKSIVGGGSRDRQLELDGSVIAFGGLSLDRELGSCKGGGGSGKGEDEESNLINNRAYFLAASDINNKVLILDDDDEDGDDNGRLCDKRDPAEIFSYESSYLWLFREIAGVTSKSFEEVTP